MASKTETTQKPVETVQPGESEVKQVAKLSAKNAGVNPKKILALDGEKAVNVIAQIMGIVSGFKQVDDPVEGKSHFPLTGAFQAINPNTGTRTQSGVCYLPTGIHDQYLAAAKKLKDGEELRFAVELRTVKSTNAAGYSYEAVSLLKPVAGNPLDQLLAEVTAPKQLTEGQ